MNNEEIVKNFKEGKIGIFPTDTAFGIGCIMTNISSIKRLYKIRKRPLEKSLIVLVSSVDMAKDYITLTTDVEEKLVAKYWPGGLTIICKCRLDKVPEEVRSGGTTLAVRLPDNKNLCDTIEKIGVPIVAPSANYSGKQTPYDLSEVDKGLISKVDFIVTGVCTIKGVSTIVDVVAKPWKILREGVVKLKEL